MWSELITDNNNKPKCAHTDVTQKLFPQAHDRFHTNCPRRNDFTCLDQDSHWNRLYYQAKTEEIKETEESYYLKKMK